MNSTGMLLIAKEISLTLCHQKAIKIDLIVAKYNHCFISTLDTMGNAVTFKILFIFRFQTQTKIIRFLITYSTVFLKVLFHSNQWDTGVQIN